MHLCYQQSVYFIVFIRKNVSRFRLENIPLYFVRYERKLNLLTM
jgi:hypothetical protein